MSLEQCPFAGGGTEGIRLNMPHHRLAQRCRGLLAALVQLAAALNSRLRLMCFGLARVSCHPRCDVRTC